MGHPVKVRRMLQEFSWQRSQTGAWESFLGIRGAFASGKNDSTEDVLRTFTGPPVPPQLISAAASGIAALRQISCVNRYYKSNKITIIRSYPKSIQCYTTWNISQVNFSR